MLLFFSDLDGTLLDHDTYRYDAAAAALDLLKARGCPLVLVSSKTFPEMKLLHEEMRLSAPFVFENGGGIFWQDSGGRIEHLGMSASELRERRNELETAFGEAVLFITEMDADEIMRRSGLPRERALLSQQRTVTLPFILASGKMVGAGKLTRINAALHHKGLGVTRGGRFYHFLSAGSDKGVAIRKVVEHYRAGNPEPVTTAGLGDSENDIPMLGEVDIPVLVRRKDGTAIAVSDRRIRITAGAGPAGFSEAVTAIISEFS